ncbi:MAG: TIGR03905 family TSCPD domain-containing protein [Oscillospiraceae bacterium]|nr:TIGR03905 family TSCPD domain-containing protein [Oscillospiraceae bacterium]
MTLHFQPKGVCSREMIVNWEGDTITSIEVLGGCSGNLQGISRLVAGMKLEDAIERLAGIRCGGKATSCPDQLSKALVQAQAVSAASEE